MIASRIHVGWSMAPPTTSRHAVAMTYAKSLRAEAGMLSGCLSRWRYEEASSKPGRFRNPRSEADTASGSCGGSRPEVFGAGGALVGARCCTGLGCPVPTPIRGGSWKSCVIRCSLTLTFDPVVADRGHPLGCRPLPDLLGQVQSLTLRGLTIFFFFPMRGLNCCRY